MNDIKKTQHFTSNYETILFNISFSPKEAIDPFAGEGDLVKYSPSSKWELYDLEPKFPYIQKNDSLLSPPCYKGKTVITNPPYLAKNKTKEFDSIFKKYNTNDLYKAAIISLIRGECNDGILIIPINFFTDKESEDVRCQFFSQYRVEYVNYFEEKIFENTSYNICAFYFKKEYGGTRGNVHFYEPIKKLSLQTPLIPEYGYRVGGKFYSELQDITPCFSRLIKDNTCDHMFPTYIFLEALDTRTISIHLSMNKNLYMGTSSDRVHATLTCKKKLSYMEQEALIEKFNYSLNEERKRYGNLLLTNYRDWGRKRISFEDVYRLCTKILYEMEHE